MLKYNFTKNANGEKRHATLLMNVEIFHRYRTNVGMFRHYRVE